MMRTRRTSTAGEATEPQRRHKRTASTASIDRIEESSQQEEVITQDDAAPQKRRKRTKKSSKVTTTTVTDDMASSQPVVVAEKHTTRKIRLSEPLPRGNTLDVDSHDRRATLSPGHFHASQTTSANTEVQFAPLTTTYGIDTRTRRRLARGHLSEVINDIDAHKRQDAQKQHELETLKRMMQEKDEVINQLLFEVEVQRQNAIDIGADEPEEVQRLSARLDQHKREKEELEKSHSEKTLAYPTLPNLEEAEEMEDSEDLTQTLIDSDPVQHGQNGVTLNAKTLVSTLPERDSQLTTASERHEADIAGLENEIHQQAKELAEANAQLRILNIELDALGFPPGGDAETVLSTVRTAFASARLTLEAIFQESFEDLDNATFLKVLTERSGSLKAKLEVTRIGLQQRIESYTVLEEENSKLIVELDTVDGQMEVLQEQLRAEQDARAEDGDVIMGLEEQLETAHKTLDEREAQIVEHSTEIATLKTDVADKDVSRERLKNAMDMYLVERNNLEQIITKMEGDHAATIENLTAKSATALAEMQAKHDQQASWLAVAEADADQKQTFITGLEIAFERSESRVDELREKLEQLNERLAAEQGARADTELTLATVREEKAELEMQLAAADQDVEDLKSTIADLNLAVESERNRVTDVSVENDEHQSKITSLEKKIQELGVQANELRSKLFNAQVTHENAMEEMKDAAAAVEDQFQADLNAESERREQAEAEAEEHKATIADINARLLVATDARDALEKENDELVALKNAEIASLNAEMDNMQEDQETFAHSAEAKVAGLNARILALETAITAHEDDITRLQTDLDSTRANHELVVNEKNGEIEDLETELEGNKTALATAQAQNDELLNQNEEVEQALVETQAQHTNEVAEMKNMIQKRDAVIAELTAKFTTTESEYTETITEKERQFNALEMHTEKLEAYIGKLESDLEHAKATFGAEIEDRNHTTDAIERELRNAMSRVESIKEAQLDRSQDRSALIKSLEAHGVDVKQLLTPDASQALGGAELAEEKITVKTKKLKTKKGGKKRSSYRDSGFGAEEDEDVEEGNGMLAA